MRADIFCRVVDNYGDIGVCWRLARRMVQGHQWQVRLWVDDLNAFARIQPGIARDLPRQTLNEVEIIHWTAQPEALAPGEVVIEAFACDPPASFVQAMRDRLEKETTATPIWINLEYLSAESWVESCHGLPSQRPDGLTKYFFFPGFTPATGGLLREPGLSQARDALQQSRAMQENFLQNLGVNEFALQAWRTGARLISLFCYPYAPVAGFAQALVDNERPTVLLVPDGVAPNLESELARVEHNTSRTQGLTNHVQVARVPFVSQPDFDRMLWCADLNFVRGEDSFVRAAWAARPLVWQIYAQDEDAHLEKLESWLTRYAGPPEAQAVIRAWNKVTPTATSERTKRDQSEHATPSSVTTALACALQGDAWARWQQAACLWDAEQTTRPDLGDSLAEFCAELSKKR